MMGKQLYDKFIDVISTRFSLTANAQLNSEFEINVKCFSIIKSNCSV